MKKLFTLIELIVVVSIIVVLCAFLLAALNAGRERIEETQCTGNFAQLGYLTAEFVEDNNGKVYTGYWLEAVKQYTMSPSDFANITHCPADDYDWEYYWENVDDYEEWSGEGDWFRNYYDRYNMPTVNVGADMLFNMQGRVKAAMVTNPSDKVLLFDFSRYKEHPVSGVAQFNYFADWFGPKANRQYRDVGPDSYLPAEDVYMFSGNTDMHGNEYGSGPRFRHGDNEKCGMLAVDGHSFIVDINEVTPRMTVDPHWYQGNHYPDGYY